MIGGGEHMKIVKYEEEPVYDNETEKIFVWRCWTVSRNLQALLLQKKKNLKKTDYETISFKQHALLKVRFAS